MKGNGRDGEGLHSFGHGGFNRVDDLQVQMLLHFLCQTAHTGTAKNNCSQFRVVLHQLAGGGDQPFVGRVPLLFKIKNRDCTGAYTDQGICQTV